MAALLGGLLRLGFLANFISQPVLKGFIIGLALTIIVGQLPKLFGISHGSGDFFEQAWHFVTHLGDTQGLTLLVGALSLALILGLAAVAPGRPGSLVAVGRWRSPRSRSSASTSRRSARSAAGCRRSGCPTSGSATPAGWPRGLGVMLIAFAEGLGAAKAFAAGGHERIDANRELVALGGANLASGLCSGMVVAGSLSKTAVNASAGARTQVSGLLAAALDRRRAAVLDRALRGPPRGDARPPSSSPPSSGSSTCAPCSSSTTPTPSGSGASSAWVARPDFIAAVAALLGVLVFGTLPGLFIGIGVSLLLLIYRASRPYVAVLGRTPGPGRDLPRRRAPRRRPPAR